MSEHQELLPEEQPPPSLPTQEQSITKSIPEQLDTSLPPPPSQPQQPFSFPTTSDVVKSLVLRPWLVGSIAILVPWFVGWLDLEYWYLFFLPAIAIGSIGALFVANVIVNHQSEILLKNRLERLKERRHLNLESLDWLNNLLNLVLKNYGTFAANQIKQQIEPIIAAKKPGFIQQLTFHDIQFGRLSPKLHYLVVPKTPDEDLIIDTYIQFESELDVQTDNKIGLGFLSQIAQLNFLAKVRIQAKLIANIHPFVSVLRVSLLEKPQIDIVVKPFFKIPFDLLALPGVEWIKLLIQYSLLEVMGYPKYHEVNIVETMGLKGPIQPRIKQKKVKESSAFGAIGDGVSGAVKGVGHGVVAVGELGVEGVEMVGGLGVSAVKGVGHGVVAVGELGVEGVGKVGELGIDAVKGVGGGVMKIGELGVGGISKVGGLFKSKDKDKH